MGTPTTFLRPLRRLAMIALAVLASGCLTIEEHYTFHKNGSGTMEYVVDMSDTKALSESMSSKKSKDDEQGDEMGLKKKSDRLKAIEGISGVKLKNKDDGYIRSVRFKFKDIDALNRALNVILQDSTGKQQAFFRWEGNTLVRSNNQQTSEMGKGMNGGSDTTGLSGILQGMHYKYSFKFPWKVDSTELAEGMAKESPNAKSLELSTDWSWIMKDPKTLDLRISLVK